MLTRCLFGQDDTAINNRHGFSCYRVNSSGPHIFQSQSHRKIEDSDKMEMFKTFQMWALRNYGDTAKTKTVTCKKYDRIVRTLTGEEPAATDNSKFRFWVKAKGFRLGPAPGDGTNTPEDQVLYVPTKLPVSLLN